jgi:hypothetical protein
VYKLYLDDGCIAADLFIFIDDLRPTCSSCKEACLVARQAPGKLNFLGIQDAPRTQQDSSQSPGVWAGGVIQMTKDEVFVLTSKE